MGDLQEQLGPSFSPSWPSPGGDMSLNVRLKFQLNRPFINYFRYEHSPKSY